MSAGGELYELSYHTRNDAAPGGPPCIFKSGTLAAALATAWRNQHAGGQSRAITKGDATVLSDAGLARALELISEISADAPMLSIIEIAEQLLREGRLEASGLKRAGEGTADD
jgi:hypothetical protein